MGRKIYMGLMLMLELSDTIELLAMASSVHWYGHVLRRDDCHILRRSFDFELEGNRMIGRPKRTWKRRVDEECVKIGLRREDELLQSKWSVGVNQIAAGLR